MAEATGLRNNALPYPVYGVPWGIVFPLLDADGDPISPSSPDSEVSKNGDTFADCTNEATEIATSSGICYLLLTGTELTADAVAIQIKSTGAKTTVFGLYPRKLPQMRSGTVGANAADGSTCQLDSGASPIDDYYNGCLLVATIDSVVEARIISDYVGSTKVCTVSPNFNTAPDNNDTFVVYLPDGRQIMDGNTLAFGGNAGTFASGIPNVNASQISGDSVAADNLEAEYDGTGYKSYTRRGTAQAGANGSITLDSGASATNSYYNEMVVAIISGTGAGQSRIITGYTGSSKVATVSPNWSTNPASDSVFVILPFGVTPIQAGLATSTSITNLDGKIGTPTDLGGGATIADNIDDSNAFIRGDIDTLSTTIDPKINSIMSYLNGVILENPFNIGSTGNDTTHIHMPSLTYADDEPNGYLLVIRDISASRSYVRVIRDWVNSTKLATVDTLPFTPQNSTDVVYLLNLQEGVDVKRINNIKMIGIGETGDEFRPE